MTVEVNDADNINVRSCAVISDRICDENGRTYFCFSSYGSSVSYLAEQLHCASIFSIRYADICSPKTELSEALRTSYKIGLIALPSITVTDESNIAFIRVRLFSPSRKKILLADNKFSAGEKGKYLLIAEAEDEYGNLSRFSFTVTAGYINEKQRLSFSSLFFM